MSTSFFSFYQNTLLLLETAHIQLEADVLDVNESVLCVNSLNLPVSLLYQCEV